MVCLLICTEIWPKNGHLLHRKLTRLRLPRYLKTQLFALLDAGHFQVAKSGSIQRANQHSVDIETHTGYINTLILAVFESKAGTFAGIKPTLALYVQMKTITYLLSGDCSPRPRSDPNNIHGMRFHAGPAMTRILCVWQCFATKYAEFWRRRNKK